MKQESTTVFGDYVCFFDESGDAQLGTIDPQYPMFVLACCIIKKSDYINLLLPRLSQLKMDFWGHDGIVLHEYEIRKPNAEYAFLFDKDKRQEFLSRLDTLFLEMPFHVIASVIDKSKLKAKYASPYDPYNLCLKFTLERLVMWLYQQGQQGKTITLFAECRGPKEDNELELEYRRIMDGQHNWHLPHFRVNFDILKTELRFAPKFANLAGLQLADLIARPIGLSVLRPEQPNKAFETIEKKLICDASGKINGHGLKIFP